MTKMVLKTIDNKRNFPLRVKNVDELLLTFFCLSQCMNDPEPKSTTLRRHPSTDVLLFIVWVYE